MGVFLLSVKYNLTLKENVTLNLYKKLKQSLLAKKSSKAISVVVSTRSAEDATNFCQQLSGEMLNLKADALTKTNRRTIQQNPEKAFSKVKSSTRPF